MVVVFGLLMVLLELSNAVETTCAGRQDGVQCYGALGGTLNLQLGTNTSKISKLKLWRRNEQILTLRDGFIRNVIQDRSAFTDSNETFRINNLTKNDSDKYVVEITNSAGRKTETTLQLKILAPVSSPKLVPECLSQGEMLVSCSSEEGDSPQYSWTLDGHMLTDTKLLSGNSETKNITLRQGLSGRLLCTAKNNVSKAASELQITPCEGLIFINCTLSNGTAIELWVLKANNTMCVMPTSAPTSTMGKEPDTTVPINPPHITPANETGTSLNSPVQWYMTYMPHMIGSLCGIIVLVVAVAFYCACKGKKETKEKDNQELQDVIYADVKFTPRHAMPRPQQVEMEVEYGEVRFSKLPKRRIDYPADDTLYAVTRKSQRS